MYIETFQPGITSRWCCRHGRGGGRGRRRGRRRSRRLRRTCGGYGCGRVAVVAAVAVVAVVVVFVIY